jgi:hypothetical protein
MRWRLLLVLAAAGLPFFSRMAFGLAQSTIEARAAAHHIARDLGSRAEASSRAFDGTGWRRRPSAFLKKKYIRPCHSGKTHNRNLLAAIASMTHKHLLWLVAALLLRVDVFWGRQWADEGLYLRASDSDTLKVGFFDFNQARVRPLT